MKFMIFIFLLFATIIHPNSCSDTKSAEFQHKGLDFSHLFNIGPNVKGKYNGAIIFNASPQTESNENEKNQKKSATSKKDDVKARRTNNSTDKRNKSSTPPENVSNKNQTKLEASSKSGIKRIPASKKTLKKNKISYMDSNCNLDDSDSSDGENEDDSDDEDENFSKNVMPLVLLPKKFGQCPRLRSLRNVKLISQTVYVRNKPVFKAAKGSSMSLHNYLVIVNGKVACDLSKGFLYMKSF